MTRPGVVVLDYGSGNLRSAQRALERAGADVTVTADPQAALAADGLVVPGVGAFATCAAGLRSIGGRELIESRLSTGRPVLGICVGMQVLFARGLEHGVEATGLGQWAGAVDRIDAPVLPHMGWNTVDAAPGSELFAGVDADARVYFVHSYGVRRWTSAESARVSWATHGERFVAAVEDGPLWATQFHPEKSGAVGTRLLTNWLNTL